MKRQSLACLVAIPVVLIALSAQAHDPKEHMKEAQQPDCAAMKGMDHAKMDMKDPVMQAMMKKCMKAMDHGKDGSRKGEADHSKHDKKADAKNPDKHEHKK